MIQPKGFKKEYKWRKQGGARFAGVPQIPSNDPKHAGVDKDWIKKFVADLTRQQVTQG